MDLITLCPISHEETVVKLVATGRSQRLRIKWRRIVRVWLERRRLSEDQIGLGQLRRDFCFLRIVHLVDELVPVLRFLAGDNFVFVLVRGWIGLRDLERGKCRSVPFGPGYELDLLHLLRCLDWCLRERKVHF